MVPVLILWLKFKSLTLESSYFEVFVGLTSMDRLCLGTLDTSFLWLKMSLQLKELEILKMKGEDGDSEIFNSITFYIQRAWSDQSEIKQREMEHQRRIGSKDKV